MCLEQSLLRADAEELTRLSQQMDSLRNAVQITDGKINAYPRQEYSRNDIEINEKRKTIIKKILDKQKKIMPQIQTLMAMRASELNIIKNGRSLLGGYGAAKQKTGGIINTSN